MPSHLGGLKALQRTGCIVHFALDEGGKKALLNCKGNEQQFVKMKAELERINKEYVECHQDLSLKLNHDQKEALGVTASGNHLRVGFKFLTTEVASNSSIS